MLKYTTGTLFPMLTCSCLYQVFYLTLPVIACYVAPLLRTWYSTEMRPRWWEGESTRIQCGVALVAAIVKISHRRRIS